MVVGSAMGLANSGADATTQAGAGASLNSSESGESVAANVNADEAITDQTFIEAEKLAHISFTPPQREMMQQSIPQQIDRFKRRVEHGYLPNQLAPAQTFDPRLHGMSFDHVKPMFIRSSDDAGALPRNDEDIAFAPATKLSRWIERGELSSTRLTSIYLDRLRQFGPKLECIVTLTDELAMKQAEQADREISAGRYRGPLHGIPWGAKDLLDTAGIRTTWGATPYRDRVPDSDAAVVKMLHEAGAVLAAKLTLGALAYGDIWFDGRTNNPWNLEQGSSGSSAGSAAATAAGLVGFSIGTETYGSIVSPCMRCGTTGLRPTFGRVDRTGAMALCWSLDKIGPICRTVEDTLLVLDAINGRHESTHDPSLIDLPLHFDAGATIRGRRLGYNPDWFSTERRFADDFDRRALEVVRELGIELVPIELPPMPYDSLLSILFCEAAAAFEELTRTGQDETLRWQAPVAWPNTFRQSWFVPGIELIQAERLRRRCMEMMAEIMRDIDGIIAPSFAPPMLLLTNFTGHPTLVLRTGIREDGSPRGITLIGHLFDEGTLGSIGMAMERSLDVWHKRPSLA
jgi:Asp-tRNA(Asn)/Glu-tRNA(Gln) amidotransferase A subunit family amidase